MANVQISRDEMMKRVAIFKDQTPSSFPLIDAVLPQFKREIFTIIGNGVLEDPNAKPAIADVDGFHLNIIKAAPQMGTGLHKHTTVEVFMPLTGRWAIQWGDTGENEIVLDPFDVVSVPIGVMRGFRNESASEALIMAIVGGTDPGRVDWVPAVTDAARARGFALDVRGKIIELAAP